MRTWSRAVVVLTLLLASLAIAARSASGGETVTDGEVRIDRQLTQNGPGCRAVWWIVLDDLPNVAQFEVTVRSIDVGNTLLVTFNKHNNPNQWAGTEFDYPAPAGKLHKPLFTGTSGSPCGSADFAEYVADGVVVTQFAVDPAVAGQAAIEVTLVPTGDACTVAVWVSVPKIPTAKEYRIDYVRGSSAGDQEVSLTLTPDQFNPVADRANVPEYDSPGRLGHFLRGASAGGWGCTRLAWIQLDRGGNGAPILNATFDVTTRTCFGRQPTIIAIPGVRTNGTSGNDVILGTTGRDVIRGGGGNDRICSLGGPDIVRGGSGRDRIDLGKGADIGRGQRGNDIIEGRGGRDLLVGGAGTDRCLGGPARDELRSCER